MNSLAISFSERILFKCLSTTIKYLAACLFFLMLSAPFDYVALKISIISLLVIISIGNILLARKINISKPVLKWFLAFIGFGCFFSLTGLLFSYNQVSNILRSMPVNVGWPILYCVMIPFINDRTIITFLHKIMVLATLFISIYLLCATFSYLGLLPFSPDFFSNVKPIVGKYDATVQLFTPSTTSLLFLLPFLMTYLSLQLFKNDKISLILILLALVLGLAAVIVTARRALILNILLCPALIYIFLKFSKIKLDKSVKRKLLKIVVIFLLLTFIGSLVMIRYEILKIDPLIQLFKDGFDFSNKSDDIGSIERAQQSIGLIHSWKDHAILGSGLGTASDYVIRSDVTPWVYELSYLSLLYQTGLIGFLIYIFLLLWPFAKGISLIKTNPQFLFLLPSLVGCTCFLVGNASNPYLVAFDHMWAVFLPVGFINYCYYQTKT